MAIQNFSPLQLNSTLTVGVDDTGHDVKFYGATSDRYLWWDESEDALKLRDNTTLKIGSGSDLQIKHDGSNSYISQNDGGNLYIQQNVNDADLVLQCDDGSNGTTAYITLDGSAGYTTVQKNMVFADSVSSRFGTGGDLAIFHDGSQGYISLEGTGDLYIRNTTDDKDIIFQSDDGSGGVATYLLLDGSDPALIVSKKTILGDNVPLYIGSNVDLRLHHDGSNSYIQQTGTGDLYIQQTVDDRDIVFQSDDGSGGVTAYLTLDGSTTQNLVHKDLRFDDNIGAVFGSGAALKLHSDGSNGIIDNFQGNLIIRQQVDDADIVFQSDNGSGGVATYFKLDGSVGGGSTVHTVFPDNSKAVFGAGLDTQIWHDGTNSYIKQQGGGDLIIQQSATDKDIILQSDDGSGGETAYLTLDGSAGHTVANKEIQFLDNAAARFGNGDDASIYHDGSNSYIVNQTGNLSIINDRVDADVILMSDNGSGGTTAYLTLDGGVGHSIASKAIRFNDSVEAFFGSSDDLKVIHNGSHSYVSHVGTGDLYLQNTTDDGNVILRSDNGSGGVTPYLTLDGSAGTVEVAKPMNLATPLATDQQKHLACFDFKGYGTSDGTNYEMMEAMSDNNAPFEHNTSTGSDGLNAQTVNIAIRSGGHVMPHTGTIKKFSGWASSAGIGNVDIGIFRFRPVDNNNGNLTPVLMVNERISSYGNAIMKVFSETESFDADFEAGDIVFSAVKGGNSSPKTWYFTSILEVEWS